MNEVFLIGGAPRCGKTTLIKQLISSKPVLGASSDALRAVLRGVVPADQCSDLFGVSEGGFGSEENIIRLGQRPDEVVASQNAESEIVWPACEDFIKSNLEDGQSVALEGVAVLPKNVAKLDINYKVVFLVNLEDQTDAVLKYAHQNESDWLSKYSDELKKAFCVFNRRMNEYIYAEANTYNLPVKVVSSRSFEKDIASAVQMLLKV